MNSIFLSSLIESGELFDQPRRIEKYIIQMLCGLAYMHANGMCHGDFHERNILLKNQRIKIADFGCVKNLSAENINPY